MESYIVRVYRRGRNNSNEVAGLVETVGSDEKNAFQSFSGLVTAIRQALGEDVAGAGVSAPGHVYTDLAKKTGNRRIG
jgi:hypothetical protein